MGIGTRNMKKALLRALLEPTADYASWNRRAITLRVWRYWKSKIVAVAGGMGNVLSASRYASGSEWLENVRAYEKEILSRRGKHCLMRRKRLIRPTGRQ